jgi:hypothetical protein
MNTMMSYFNGFKEPAYIFKINVKHLLIHFFGFVLLHAHVIAAMEEFLSGTFIHEITNSDELMKKLIETDSKLGKKLKDKKHKDIN